MVSVVHLKDFFGRLHPTALAFIGGCVFVAVFGIRYSFIDDGLYEVRDDGIITMSHAKNWVDYGHIGVNPSGGRVEGSSAPIQLFLYALAYALGGMDYDTYSNVQTVVGTLLLGALFILFFRANAAAAVPLTLLAALLLSYHSPFILWHASGMENPVTHVLFLATLLILVWFFERKKIVYPLCFVVFLATISRLDSVLHIAPLLFIFAAFWYAYFRDARGLLFGFAVFLLWASFYCWRYYYFGDFLSNTAHAQAIDPTSLSDANVSLGKRIVARHGGFLLAAMLPLIPFIRRERTIAALSLFIAGLMSTSFFSAIILGPARIDRLRPTSFLALATTLGIVAALYYLRRRKYLPVCGGLVLILFLGIAQRKWMKPYYLDWAIGGFDKIRLEFVELARRESLFRPTVSNPDLGIMSWHKEFNIVDLGLLGSPVMTKIRHRSPGAMTEYFFHFAAPDFIESHSSWSCQYDESIFSRPEFSQYYIPVRTEVTDWTKGNCPSNPDSPSGIWIRKDILKYSDSAERRLIDSLANDLAVEALRDELNQCQSVAGNDCVYVARTAYRFLPEFRAAGKVEELERVFVNSRTKDYDLFLINGYRDGTLHERAIDFIVQNSSRDASF